jgi:SOS-response transcriptional repressor LexA
MITAGEGRYRVWLEHKQLDDGMILILGGGEKAHIGGLVICEPGKQTTVTRFKGHYDDIVLKPLAEAACTKYATRVVAVGGVHVDNATKEEIDLLVENCRRLITCI